MQDTNQEHPFGLRRLRLVTGVVLFAYILSHLLNHALGLVGLSTAERALAIAKAVWYSTLGTSLLYGAAACHVLLALRTIYLRKHWRLPLIEYVRLSAGFSLPLLLIGHVVTTRVAFSLYGTNAQYSSVVATLISSGSEGWQLALLAPGWLHGCLGLWISFARFRPSRGSTWAFFLFVALVPCLAAAGFFSMRSELLAQQTAVSADAVVSSPPAANTETLIYWRKTALGFYLFVVAGALLAGPARRALTGNNLAR
jgi:adenylate cyclase